jgi:hypothetical protein
VLRGEFSEGVEGEEDIITGRKQSVLKTLKNFKAGT